MISREDLIEQSVTEWVREQIFTVRAYPTSQVDLVESYPYKMRELDKNIIALGFNFDDNGEQAEMGSDLKRRVYTIEHFVFGKTNTYARNLANVLKFALDVAGTIPLLDIAQDPPVEIDRLMVIGVRAERQVVNNPEPWEEFVWTTTLQLEDVYVASLV